MPEQWLNIWAQHKNELGQIIVRLTFAILIGIYVVSAGIKWGFGSPRVIAPAIVYAVAALIAIGHLAHLLVTRRKSLVRIFIGIAIDVASLSLFLYFGDAVTAPFFPVYLWITLANGFRFGERVLVTTAVLSVVSFAAVTIATPFWTENYALAMGLLVALIALPSYVFQLLESLNEARAQAETANEAKSRFLAVISHEFRTPLNAIIGLSDILRVSRLSSDQQQMIRSVGMSANALMDLMDDLLEFSRLDSGKVDHAPQEFDLFQLLAEVEAILAPQANQKGLTFYLRVLTQIPGAIVGDKRYLREVILNLTANAVKYTDAGNISISVSCDKALADNADAGVRLRFEVSDTGAGIPTEQHDLIFDSFTQTEEARNSMRGGVGLGLAICKRMTEAMGGQISLTSTPGAGSTFTVDIPFDVTVDSSTAKPKRGKGFELICVGNPSTMNQKTRANFERNSAAIWVDNFNHLSREAAGQIQRGCTRPVIAIFADHVLEGGHSNWEPQLASFRRGLSDLPIILWFHSGRNTEGYRSAVPCQAIDMIADGALEIDMDNALAFAAARITDPSSDNNAASPVSGDVSLEILVAEDNRINRTVASRILRSLGHRVDLVEDGQQALEAMASMRYDIVFMDINMPVMDGLEATKMRRYEEMGGERTSIIALTADAMPDTDTKCAEAGMDGITHKPVSATSLQNAIDQLLSEQPHILKPRELIMDEKVKIATHPRFQESLPNILDLEKIGELHSLDESGEFLATVAHEFVEDAVQLVSDIEHAIGLVDLSEFRDLNHALRSCAANVGAKRLFVCCETMSGSNRGRLAEEGAQFIEDLREALRITSIEFERVSMIEKTDLQTTI